MTKYRIPTSELMTNDSGNGIKVLTVQEPTNGETLLGTVKLIDTTVYYYSPTSTANAPVTADNFGYTIEDVYGQKAHANVRVVFPADIADERPLAFIGPYSVNAIAGFSNGAFDVGIWVNPTDETAQPSFYGSDVLCIGTIIVLQGYPLDLAPGWTKGAAHVQGEYTLYEFQRVFTADEYMVYVNKRGTIPLIVGRGNLPNGDSPPPSLLFDLKLYTCPGASTASLLQHFDITSFGSVPQTVNFTNYVDGVVYESIVHALVNTPTTNGVNPVISKPPMQFFGYSNDFICGLQGLIPKGDQSPNPLNGITFYGHDLGFTTNRIFKAVYK